MAENHNSSRSNKTYPAASGSEPQPPTLGNVFIACPAEIPFSILQTMADQIQLEIDKNEIEKKVRVIVVKNKVSGINNIVCEVRVLLVRGAWAVAAARGALLAEEARLRSCCGSCFSANEVGIKEEGVK